MIETSRFSVSQGRQPVTYRPRIIVVDGPDPSAQAELARKLPDRHVVHGAD